VFLSTYLSNLQIVLGEDYIGIVHIDPVTQKKLLNLFELLNLISKRMMTILFIYRCGLLL